MDNLRMWVCEGSHVLCLVQFSVSVYIGHQTDYSIFVNNLMEQMEIIITDMNTCTCSDMHNIATCKHTCYSIYYIVFNTGPRKKSALIVSSGLTDQALYSLQEMTKRVKAVQRIGAFSLIRKNVHERKHNTEMKDFAEVNWSKGSYCWTARIK